MHLSQLATIAAGLHERFAGDVAIVYVGMTAADPTFVYDGQGWVQPAYGAHPPVTPEELMATYGSCRKQLAIVYADGSTDIWRPDEDGGAMLLR